MSDLAKMAQGLVIALEQLDDLAASMLSQTQAILDELALARETTQEIAEEVGA